MEEIAIRGMEPRDLNFILATWLNCYRHAAFTRHIPNAVYFEWHERVIKRILDRGSDTYVAVLKEDPLVILGYLVLERYTDRTPILHFAYVKSAFQKMGILGKLLAHANVDLNEKHELSHRTNELVPILEKYPKLIFNPYWM